VPIVVGAGPTIALAKRWKNQLNENSKVPAWTAELPEADHNEVVGWERASEFANLHAVFLDDPSIDERTRRRIEPTARAVAAATRVEAPGDTLLERVLAMTLLGDLVSVYLAALDDLDPAEIEAIDTLKEELQAD
jgi:glucose/mannose-6-phosphate isomerase